jgi:hypothetical protein
VSTAKTTPLVMGALEQALFTHGQAIPRSLPPA